MSERSDFSSVPVQYFSFHILVLEIYKQVSYLKSLVVLVQLFWFSVYSGNNIMNQFMYEKVGSNSVTYFWLISYIVSKKQIFQFFG